MKLSQSSKFNRNYSAKIVEVTEFVKHPNPKCERLKMAIVDGFHIAVSIDTQPGEYVYFPVECCINSSYLAANNLFRDSTMNKNPNMKGFFEANCRVRAIKLQGVPSEGLLMPIDSLTDWMLFIKKSISLGVKVGIEFDTVEDEWLCKKYIVINKVQTSRSKITKKVTKELNKVDNTQFRFHYDTVIIKRCPWVIQPDSLISLTYKMHGTSGISSRVLCYKPYGVWQKIKMKLGINVHRERYYDYLWSSRTVIKDPYYNPNVSQGYYNVDVWKLAHDIVSPRLLKGMSAYYEICGFLPNGNYIQKGFDYGCISPKSKEDYKEGTNFKVYIYRLTYTNEDGNVFEFSARQVQQWCNENGLRPVIEAYYGYAKDLYSDLDTENHWNENFIDRLANDKNFYMELDSPHCTNKVPHEGLVIKIENFKSEAFKLKCNRFLNKETELLDKGYSDIETES